MEDIERTFYTLDELRKMPVKFLRCIDIQNKKEEELVQIVVTEKLSANPTFEVNTKGVPDIFTKEDEEKWQAILDKRRAKLIQQHGLEHGNALGDVSNDVDLNDEDQALPDGVGPVNEDEGSLNPPGEIVDAPEDDEDEDTTTDGRSEEEVLAEIAALEADKGNLEANPA